MKLEGGKRERGEEKNKRGESLIKRVINRRGTLNPETVTNASFAHQDFTNLSKHS